MLLTEDEAKTKWCPHYLQYQGDDGTGDNRPGPGFNPLCLGSACMAWRWGEPAEKHERRMCDACGGSGYRDAAASICPKCDETGYILIPYPTPARQGYCGAFGKPEA